MFQPRFDPPFSEIFFGKILGGKLEIVDDQIVRWLDSSERIVKGSRQSGRRVPCIRLFLGRRERRRSISSR
jgi:hypothetical protein